VPCPHRSPGRRTLRARRPHRFSRQGAAAPRFPKNLYHGSFPCGMWLPRRGTLSSSVKDRGVRRCPRAGARAPRRCPRPEGLFCLPGWPQARLAVIFSIRCSPPEQLSSWMQLVPYARPQPAQVPDGPAPNARSGCCPGKLRQTVSECATVDGAYFADAGRLPGTGGGTASWRPGLSESWRCRQKSRASVLVAWSHGTSTAQVNRNQRSSASEYDRCVVAGRPAACRSRRNSDTGSTRPPPGPLRQYGSHRSPVSTSPPAAGTTSAPRSRGLSSSPSAMGSDRNDRHPGASGD